MEAGEHEDFGSHQLPGSQKQLCYVSSALEGWREAAHV